MNNLILSCIALVSAGVLWLSQRNALEAARANQQTLHQELAVAREALAETGASITSAQDQLALRLKELNWARSESATTPLTRPVPPDPAREGLWPKDKPYCYLSKQHLATIGFTPFSADDSGLTWEAGTLFGMSAAERTAVDRAYLNFVDGIHQLHLANAELLETKGATDNETHREITYRIPTLTNEFRQLRGAFVASLEQTLGPSRTDVFFKRAKSQLDDVYGQYGKDGYTIKYSADRQPDGTTDHQLNIEQLNRRGSHGYRIQFPIDPASGMWKYRHLLGDQPLLPTPVTEAN
jgi:hypothetical protein